MKKSAPNSSLYLNIMRAYKGEDLSSLYEELSVAVLRCPDGRRPHDIFTSRLLSIKKPLSLT